LAENQTSSILDLIDEARQRLATELRAQAEHILKLNRELAELQLLHGRTEQEASRQWDEVARAAQLAADAARHSPEAALGKVLAIVRSLMTCAIPEQVFQTLTEETSQWGVRVAIFDVRGSAAWGASARGFGPALSEKILRSLIIQLHQENPFRRVCETAEPVNANAETLKKNRNVLDKLRPHPDAPVLLLPLRSAGTVSAILYADSAEPGQPIPANALQILTEFAGAQIDRLIAQSNDFADDETREVVAAAAAEEPTEEPPTEVAAQSTGPAEHHTEDTLPLQSDAGESPWKEAAAADTVVEAPGADAQTRLESSGLSPATSHPGPASADAATETLVPPPTGFADTSSEPLAHPGDATAEANVPRADGSIEAPQANTSFDESHPAATSNDPSVDCGMFAAGAQPSISTTTVAENVPRTAAFDVSQLTEAEQKTHQDAKRFARLLVSEIELYNKGKVVEGRTNRDLYQRLKSDIDRSRQTFEKRFGKTPVNQPDYFHDELVKSLAVNDTMVLGPEYPGPTA